VQSGVDMTISSKIDETHLAEITGIFRQAELTGVSVPNPEEIRQYIVAFPELIVALPQLLSIARNHFDAHYELALQVYQGIEAGDRQLTLYVRQSPYQADLLQRIESLSEAYYPLFNKYDVYLLTTTDFREPMAR